jgi:hypothetical protein
MRLLQGIAPAIGYVVVIGSASGGAVKFVFWVFDEIQKPGAPLIRVFCG